MMFRFSRFFLLGALILMGCMFCLAQTPDPSFGRPGDASKEETPKSLKETLEKLRIEKEKKEHNQMLERGGEIVKITVELEKTVDQNGRLTDKEYSKVATVEKLVKKIRNELGGDDDDGDDPDDQVGMQNKGLSPTDAVKSLVSKTAKLFDELKKTTRFTISASAIQASNSVLRLARFLKLSH